MARPQPDTLQPTAVGGTLERQLRDTVAGQVSFTAGDRALYTMDASNYRSVPQGVVLPRTVDDVMAAVEACREHQATIVPRGGGTSIGGNAIGPGVVVDTSRHLNQIIDIDPDAHTATVQPGVVLDDLQAAAAPYGLRFGPDPSTHSRCTLGGMIGNNACGSHSVAWGKTADNVESLDVLSYDGTRLTVGATDRATWDALRTEPGRSGQIHAQIDDLVQANLALLRTQLPHFPRRVSGYSLDHLLPEHGGHLARALVGTEGSLVTVLGATVKLHPLPAAKVLLVLGYTDDVAAASAAPGILPFQPLTVEGMNAGLVDILRSRTGGARGQVDLPDGGGWLFVEIGGDTVAEAEEKAYAVIGSVECKSSLVVTDPAEQRRLWKVREEGSGLATRLADGSEAWPGWEDAAVPPENLGGYIRDFTALLRKHDLKGLPYGHFGDGCIHVRISFDFDTEAGLRTFRRFMEEAADTVASHGGTLSGEHGDGRARAELLDRIYSPQMLQTFGAFKAIWDPTDAMNPGVVVRPDPIDAQLRFAPLPLAGSHQEPATTFAYDSDGGSIVKAARRCVGVGKCRADTGGVMCPSYRATRDEKHSTRGRAHLLFEMLTGDTITDGWRSEEVRDALDLCLSCKGCKSDCPVEVDMATYKAEFLHQHYAGRVRPTTHYSMGWLPLWLRLGSRFAPVINALTSNRLIASVAKKLGGVTPERDIPRFARRSFVRRWRAARRRAWEPPPSVASAVARAKNPKDAEGTGWPTSRRSTGPAGSITPVEPTADVADIEGTEATQGVDAGEEVAAATPQPTAATGPARGRRVVLWPDTFTNYFDPELGMDAVGVLESLGYTVEVPTAPVCCGLTWVSTGQLDRAKKVLQRTLQTLRPWLDEGVPVVGLEPSCTALFRGELTELFASDPTAKRLKAQTVTFAELLAQHADEIAARRAAAGAHNGGEDGEDAGGRTKAIVQTHCHQHAELGDAADRTVLGALGVDAEVLDSGCCGLAGNFGFEKGHYDVSMACAQRALLPAVRDADAETAVLADGFSCRTQVRQASEREPVHLAQIAAKALGLRRRR